MGFELEDEELQTTPIAAARELDGRRVFALVMSGIVPDLDGVELVGDTRRRGARRRRGRDGRAESGLQLHEPRRARSPSSRRAPSCTACTRTSWWQTARGPMLDGGAFVAGLEYATGVEATVLGKPSAAYFAAALAALDAEPELTWMITDDLEPGRRGRAALRHEDGAAAHRQVPPGDARALGRRFPTRCSARSRTSRTGSSAPASARNARRHRPDRDRARAQVARAVSALQGALLHPGRAGLLRLAPESGRELRGPLRRQGGGREGARVRGRAGVYLDGDRDRRAPEAVGAALRPGGRVGASASRRGRSTSR